MIKTACHVIVCRVAVGEDFEKTSAEVEGELQHAAELGLLPVDTE